MKPAIRFERPHVEGDTFRRMAVAESGGRYRFKLLRDFVYIYNFDLFPANIQVSFRDEHDREWMRMTRRTKVVREGYAWNGNSWKRGIRVFGKDVWLGTPDTHPGTLEASGGHDPDFQFAHCEHFPLTWSQCNYHYLLLAQANKYRLANLFHGALEDASRPAWESAEKNPVHSIVL
jgi:hypothetical protein